MAENLDIAALLPLLFFILLTVAAVQLLRIGFYSLSGKSISRPPSDIFWAAVVAQVNKRDKFKDVVYPEPEAFQASHVRTRPNAINDVTKVVNATMYSISYEYNGKTYTARKKGLVTQDGTALIYCRKRNPQISKQYIPRPALSKEAAIAHIFIGIAMLGMGALFIIN